MEPYHNENFSSPVAVTQSLWAGVMTWCQWRKYVELASGMIISLVGVTILCYAGILHQFVLYLAFSDLDFNEYSPRITGNKSIEAMHSVLHGGTTNLPITSANLTFQDFLSRLRKLNI